MSILSERDLKSIEGTETQETWQSIHDSIVKLNKQVRNSDKCQVISVIKSIKEPLNRLIISDRTRLSGVSVELISTLVDILGDKFEPLVPDFLVSLSRLCLRTNKVTVSRAQACLVHIASNVPMAKHLHRLADWQSSLNKSMRLTVMEMIIAISSQEFEDNEGLIEKLINVAMKDAASEVREKGKKALSMYQNNQKSSRQPFGEVNKPMPNVIKRLEALHAESGLGMAQLLKKNTGSSIVLSHSPLKKTGTSFSSSAKANTFASILSTTLKNVGKERGKKSEKVERKENFKEREQICFKKEKEQMGSKKERDPIAKKEVKENVKEKEQIVSKKEIKEKEQNTSKITKKIDKNDDLKKMQSRKQKSSDSISTISSIHAGLKNTEWDVRFESVSQLQKLLISNPESDSFTSLMILALSDQHPKVLFASLQCLCGHFSLYSKDKIKSLVSKLLSIIGQFKAKSWILDECKRALRLIRQSDEINWPVIVLESIHNASKPTRQSAFALLKECHGSVEALRLLMNDYDKELLSVWAMNLRHELTFEDIEKIKGILPLINIEEKKEEQVEVNDEKEIIQVNNNVQLTLQKDEIIIIRESSLPQEIVQEPVNQGTNNDNVEVANEEPAFAIENQETANVQEFRVLDQEPVIIEEIRSIENGSEMNLQDCKAHDNIDPENVQYISALESEEPEIADTVGQVQESELLHEIKTLENQPAIVIQEIEDEKPELDQKIETFDIQNDVQIENQEPEILFKTIFNDQFRIDNSQTDDSRVEETEIVNQLVDKEFENIELADQEEIQDVEFIKNYLLECIEKELNRQETQSSHQVDDTREESEQVKADLEKTNHIIQEMDSTKEELDIFKVPFETINEFQQDTHKINEELVEFNQEIGPKEVNEIEKNENGFNIEIINMVEKAANEISEKNEQVNTESIDSDASSEKDLVKSICSQVEQINLELSNNDDLVRLLETSKPNHDLVRLLEKHETDYSSLGSILSSLPIVVDEEITINRINRDEEIMTNQITNEEQSFDQESTKIVDESLLEDNIQSFDNEKRDDECVSAVEQDQSGQFSSEQTIDQEENCLDKFYQVEDLDQAIAEASVNQFLNTFMAQFEECSSAKRVDDNN